MLKLVNEAVAAQEIATKIAEIKKENIFLKEKVQYLEEELKKIKELIYWGLYNNPTTLVVGEVRELL